MPKKLTYEQVKENIESFGYKLLSKEYIGANEKLKLQCPEGHKFFMRCSSFRSGQRCPLCLIESMKLSYNQVKEYIESFGFKLISTEYINSKTKIEIQCPEGHKFFMCFNNFQQGKRCPECFGNKKLTYEYVKEYVEYFGYKLISTEYINANTKIECKCPEGHKFLITLITFNFKSGQRCPECNRIKTASKGEKEVLEYTKSLTKELIVENDRNEIINPLTGHNLELDIWIPSLNKAIEFNSEFFHSYPKTVIRDREKIKQCEEKGIELLVIWENNWKNKQEQCKNLIKQHIERK